MKLCDCQQTPTSDLPSIRKHREFMLHQREAASVRVSYHFSYNVPSVEALMMRELIQLFARGKEHPDVVVLNMVLLYRPTHNLDYLWCARVLCTLLRVVCDRDTGCTCPSLVCPLGKTPAGCTGCMPTSSGAHRTWLRPWTTSGLSSFGSPQRQCVAMTRPQRTTARQIVVRQSTNQAERWLVLDARSIAKAVLTLILY